MKFLTITICFIFCSNYAFSQQNVSPIRHHIQGELTLEAYYNFEAILKSNPAITEIEFINSTGSSKNATDIVNLFSVKIDERHLKTFARGYCESTCAFVFLMGYERTLLPGSANNPTILRLHPIENTSTRESIIFETDSYIRDVVTRSNSKMPKGLLMKMYMTTDRRGAVIIKRNPNADGKFVFFQAKYGDKLSILSDLSPNELGIFISE
ncbi:hypothetical protein [Undibacterium umbellatum]|uniref:Uncharacterized protein n=1 Tax=Undibacterium umbellatum TaxID=2762300 RepID=A0ABR6ZHT3_9BURK|nr:hypothetical protein [Undibacterium umbellatum]MBC3910900.1 hypothetical protein [Undibacterium umbellatum]